MSDKELMQQALEALEEPREHIFRHRRLEAITALRERLAQPEQEPVAWQWLDTGTFRKSLPASAEPGAWRPLYTAPQPNTIANSEAIPKQISEPAQEPVAWAAVTENGKLFKAASTQEGAQRKANQQQEKFGEAWRPLRVAPLYTTPPRREWVGLTKEEAKEISLANRPYVVDMIAALEARLKEKNNG